MRYTVEVAISYSCEYNEAAARAFPLHGRDFVEGLHAQMFKEFFEEMDGTQLHSCICNVVHPENLFESKAGEAHETN